jgi:hypothetical protein
MQPAQVPQLWHELAEVSPVRPLALPGQPVNKLGKSGQVLGNEGVQFLLLARQQRALIFRPGVEDWCQVMATVARAARPTAITMGSATALNPFADGRVGSEVAISCGLRVPHGRAAVAPRDHSGA